jgi:predicted dehydrogenase
MTTQLALVGCAHIHTPGFIKRIQARNDVQVKWVWDHDTDRAAQRAGELNAAATSLENIWADGDVKAAIICSETDRHEPLVMAGAGAGKHLFVEKPLGMGATDANRMAEAIEQAGVLFQTGYFMRGDPIHQFLKTQIANGVFGKITRFRHTNCHQGSLERWFDKGWLWMTDLQQAGVGAFGDLGTHSLDVMLWMLNDVPASVTATIDTAVRNYGDCDEFGEGLMKFGSGVVGSLAAGWVDVAHPVRLVLSGTEGHAYVANNQLFFKSQHVAGATGEQPWTDLPPAWPHAFENFLDAVVGKSHAPLVAPREAAVRSAVMEAMYAAAKSHTWASVAR